MIPRFADEKINDAIAGADHDDIECYSFDICDEFSGLLYLDYGEPQLKIRRDGRTIASIEYDGCGRYCWRVDGPKHTKISSGHLMEYLMSLSDDLAMWLLWNQIL